MPELYRQLEEVFRAQRTAQAPELHNALYALFLRVFAPEQLEICLLAPPGGRPLIRRKDSERPFSQEERDFLLTSPEDDFLPDGHRLEKGYAFTSREGKRVGYVLMRALLSEGGGFPELDLFLFEALSSLCNRLLRKKHEGKGATLPTPRQKTCPVGLACPHLPPFPCLPHQKLLQEIKDLVSTPLSRKQQLALTDLHLACLALEQSDSLKQAAGHLGCTVKHLRDNLLQNCLSNLGIPLEQREPLQQKILSLLKR